MLSNYRPISSFSIFDKILEKLFYTRLSSFIEVAYNSYITAFITEYNILMDQQSGF